MLKYLFILFSCFLICQNVKAQKQDTLLYYMKNSGEMTEDRNEADYYMLIMSPDSNSNQMFRVEEYYTNRKPKLIGTSTSSKYSNLVFNGPVVSFYPNGRRKTSWNYKAGHLEGEETSYYPNGKLHYVVVHVPSLVLTQHSDMKYMEWRDSTGNILTTKGNGKWVDMDDYNVITGQGSVVDGFKDGEWHGSIGDSARYTMTYTMGRPGPGIGYDFSGKAHPFVDMEVPASFKGNGNETYSDFLQKTLVVPKVDRQNGIGGKVIITFIVEVDGKPDLFKVIRTPDESLANESVRAMLLSTWNPALRYGMPTRSYFTLPINFTVTNGR